MQDNITLREFIEEVENFRDSVKGVPLVIKAPNDELIQPKIKLIRDELDRVEKVLITY